MGGQRVSRNSGQANERAPQHMTTRVQRRSEPIAAVSLSRNNARPGAPAKWGFWYRNNKPKGGVHD